MKSSALQQDEALEGVDVVWNRNAALADLDHDETVLQNLVDVLANELTERLAALDAALAAGNDEQVRRTAHACKNSAGIMRLGQLRAAASAAESASGDTVAQAAQTLRQAILEARQALAADAPE